MLRIAICPYELHFKRPAATSRGALTTRRLYLLRAWDAGNPTRVGWGECGPLPGLTQSPLPSFTFALETALRDLHAGGRQRLWDTPFTRGEAGLPTHGLIWMDTVDSLLRQIETKVAAGFTVIKMKVGALPFVDELRLLSEIRRAYPAHQVELRLDANGAFAPDTAPGILDQLARLDVAFLEQPIGAGQWAHMAEICRLSPIPIALDEELIPIVDADTRRRLLDAVQPQHLIIKPTLLGSFRTCERWIDDATARGIQWWINSLLESNIGLNAICQWASAIGEGRVHGLGTGTLFDNNIVAPIYLAGHELVMRQDHPWIFPANASATTGHNDRM